jgi:phosphotransferase system HPr-like phosphotransfer protein
MPMTLISEKRKRILYADRDYFSESRGYSTCVYITDFLKRKYDVDTHRGLDEELANLIHKTTPANKFNALITNVPHKSIDSVSYFRHSSSFILESTLIAKAYRESLEILRQIKMVVDIPIIAYTGAGDSPAIYSIFMEEGGVDHIVHKSMDLHKDVQKIQSALENLLRKYEERPREIDKPTITIKGGYTTVEVRINLSGGLGLSSVTKISNECKTYPGSVLLKKSDDFSDIESYNGKNILDFMRMAPGEGQKIIILVEGKNEEAERIARRLYSAFSSRYSFTIDFDRFKE